MDILSVGFLLLAQNVKRMYNTIYVINKQRKEFRDGR